ncbi:unnamed protein product [Choristocarpus tenellus]
MMCGLYTMSAAARSFTRSITFVQPLAGGLGQSLTRCESTRSLSSMANGNDNGGRKKVVFLGTPDVAARSLELLVEASRSGRGGGFEVVRVVSNPPARVGRKKALQPSPVQAFAEAENIPVRTPASARDEDFLAELEDLRPDLCVTAAYGQFLPQRFLDIPALGTLNVHPSLLPLYRGASPVQRCVEMGDAETGVSVAFTVLKMDAGPVVRQSVHKLEGNEKTPDLLQHLFEVGTENLIDCLPEVWGGSVKSTPQNDAEATKAKKISVEEAQCCFKTSTALNIHNKVRAFAGWPGTWGMFSWGEGEEEETKKVKLITTMVGDEKKQGGESMHREGGDIHMCDGALELICGDGSVLRLTELQPPGKKVMDAKSFVNGLRGAQMRWLPLDPLADKQG